MASVSNVENNDEENNVKESQEDFKLVSSKRKKSETPNEMEQDNEDEDVDEDNDKDMDNEEAESILKRLKFPPVSGEKVMVSLKRTKKKKKR